MTEINTLSESGHEETPNVTGMIEQYAEDLVDLSNVLKQILKLRLHYMKIRLTKNRLVKIPRERASTSTTYVYQSTPN